MLRCLLTASVLFSGVTPALADVHDVQILQDHFFPPIVFVAAGDTVRWTNTSETAQTIVAVDDTWTTGSIAPGATGEIVFDADSASTYRSQTASETHGEILLEMSVELNGEL